MTTTTTTVAAANAALSAAKAAREKAWAECARRWPAIVRAEQEGGVDGPRPSAAVMAAYGAFQEGVVLPAQAAVQAAQDAVKAAVEAEHGPRLAAEAAERQRRDAEAAADARRRQAQREAPGGSEHPSNPWAARNRAERLADEMRRD